MMLLVLLVFLLMFLMVLLTLLMTLLVLLMLMLLLMLLMVLLRIYRLMLLLHSVEIQKAQKHILNESQWLEVMHMFKIHTEMNNNKISLSQLGNAC